MTRVTHKFFTGTEGASMMNRLTELICVTSAATVITLAPRPFQFIGD
jgi:hypothetical protein